jgi:hypothetical protein
LAASTEVALPVGFICDGRALFWLVAMAWEIEIYVSMMEEVEEVEAEF